jgi:hypothetical protein
VEPIFIDFEASSLDLISSYPIEVGVATVNGDANSWLIKPAPLWHDWSLEAERIHGIHRRMLDVRGLDVVEVALTLNETIPDVCYCDAWSFDSFWMHRLFRAARIKPLFRLESVVQLLNPAQINRWSQVRKRVIRDTGLHTHRAGNDASILLHTWLRVKGSDAMTESGIS